MSESPDPIAEAWTALEAHWNDRERHRAFVTLASVVQRLPEAAALYRTATADPARQEGAAEGQKLVLAQALAQIEATPRTSQEQARKGGRVFIPLAVLGLMLAASVMLAGVTGIRKLASIPVVSLEILFVALLPWKRLLR